MTAPAVTPKVRWKVIERDSDAEGNPVCQWCGYTVNVASGDYSLQHRRARGMGGSKLKDTNQPHNLVLVHGSATTRCHGEIEKERARAIDRGFNIPQVGNPARVRIVDWVGREWWLTPDGRRVPVGPEPNF